MKPITSRRLLLLCPAKKPSAHSALAIGIMLWAVTAWSAPILTISDGMTSVTVTNICNGQTGKLCNPGVAFDAAWSLVIGTAFTKPSQGSATNPAMLFLLQCSSQPFSPTHNLTISFSDDNFGPLGGSFEASFSGHLASGTSQALSYNTYYDPGNVPGAVTWPLTASGTIPPLGSQDTNIARNSGMVLQPLCSLTQVLTINGTPVGSSGGSYSITLLLTFNPLPPPVLGFGSTHPFTSSGLLLSLQGTSGVHYRVDASNNLRQWTTITNFTSTNSLMYFADNAATNYPQRFYRAAAQYAP
jgi:hypothetical protein